MERMNVHSLERTGCSSENFLKPGQSIITLSHLFKRAGTVPLRDILARQTSDKKRIAYLAETTAELTGLELFPQYLTLLFEVDAQWHGAGSLEKMAQRDDGLTGSQEVFAAASGSLSAVDIHALHLIPRKTERCILFDAASFQQS